MFMKIICSFIASILGEIHLVSELIIIGPNSNTTSLVNSGVAKQRSKDMSHEFEPQNEVEVLILDADSKML